MEAPGCVSGLFLQASHGVSPGLLGLEGDPVNCTSSLWKLNMKERLAGVRQMET